MAGFYSVAYRIGFTPWERAGESGAAQLDRLLDRESAERGGPRGRALDIGCGTGAHTLDLAERGWDATGVDLVPRALDRARRRPGADRVTFTLGDATDLAAAVSGPIELFLDVGCFHGLGPAGRAAYARGVAELASPTATLLLLAFDHGAPRPMPRGVTTSEVTSAFAGWQLLEEAAATNDAPGPLRRVPVRWLRLRRTADDAGSGR
jgi:SAM-dependent methyltransferase